MKILYTFFFVVLFSNVRSQLNLSGTVSDQMNNHVPFAAISLKDFNQNEKSLSTDTTGYFIIKNLKPGQYSLDVTSVGFVKYGVEFSLQSDTSIKIELKPTIKQLNEVVVTGNKQTIENSSDKLVYNVSASVTATGSDALQALSKIPVIKINNNEISVAGKGLVRVMINNRLIQLAGEDLIRYLKSFSANQVSKIELITNPSAKYEVEGNAGLINIILKRDKKQGYSGNLQFAAKRYVPEKTPSYGMNTYGELNGSGNLNYNSGRWSSYINFNVAEDRHIEGFGASVYYPNQSWLQTDTGLYTYNNFNATAGVDYNVSSKAVIGVSYQGGKNFYDGSDNVNNPIYNRSGNVDSTLKTYAIYHPVASNNAVNIHADIKLDTTGKSLFFNADYFNYFRLDRSHFESNSYGAGGQYKPEGNARYYDTNKQVINVYTFKADADLPTKFAKFAFGGKVSFINNYSNAFYFNKLNGGGLMYNANLSNEFDYTENTQALYASINKEINKWIFEGGLRGEFTETKGYSYTNDQTTINNYFKLFPSILINYKQDLKNTFSINFGKRINRPIFWNLNPFKSLFTAYSYGEGNPYLQPEYNSNLELSHTYKSLLTSSLFLNITDNGFKSVTFVRPDTNLVFTRPINFIKAYRFGLSENLSLKISNWWESNQQASLYHTNAYSRISEINDIKGFGFYVASNNNVFLNKDKTFSGAINFWCQFPEVDHIGRSNTYYKLDLGIKASLYKKKFDVALNLNDAFSSSASSVYTTVNRIPQKWTNFQVYRYFQVSISYRFGNSLNKPEIRDRGNEAERERIP